MKKAGALILAAVLVTATIISTAGEALAGGYRYNINQRQYNQFSRIHQGIRSGALTRNEARNLLKAQARLNRQEQRFRADGQLTPQERFRLQARQNRLSYAIRRQANDNQSRY